MATHPTRKVTFEEWLHSPEDEARPTELLDGEVREMPGATLWHQELVGRLYEDLRAQLRSIGRGQVYLDANVRLASYIGVRPDLLVVLERPADPLYVERPDLAIEVVSDTWRDLKLKRERYEQYGIPEYWAVLPEVERVEVYRLDGGRYGKPMIVVPGEKLSSLAVPGIEIDLELLFAHDPM